MSSGPTIPVSPYAPSIQAPAPPRVNVAVNAIGRPAVASVATRGPQGPPGPMGQRGLQGSPGDYGAIRYDEVNATAVMMSPGVPLPFTLVAPITNTNSLRGPFANFAFLASDGRTLQARASGDTYLIRARMLVVASIAGGSFSTDLVIPGVTGSSSNRPRVLIKPAGTPEVVDDLFEAFPGVNFAGKGAAIMLTSSVPAMVTPQTLFVTPITAV